MCLMGREKINRRVRSTVLVVDDDVLALELYSRELSGDYQVLTSRSVQETRQVLQTQRLDLMVIEPAINEDEGWGLLSEIQSIADPPYVILCSVEDERKAGLGQGANAYLVKPVLPNTLHRLIDQFLLKTKTKTKNKLGKGA